MKFQENLKIRRACNYRDALRSRADQKKGFSMGNLLKSDRGIRSEKSTGTRFHGDDPLNWSFRDVGESQSWPLARQDSCGNTSEPEGGQERKRCHEIEKGRSARVFYLWRNDREIDRRKSKKDGGSGKGGSILLMR